MSRLPLVFVEPEVFGGVVLQGSGGNKLNSLALSTAHVKSIY